MGLLDDISKLTTPVAELPDVEDDNFDAPVALKSTKKGPGASLDFFEQAKKYAGKKVSRSELFGDVSEIAGLEADVDDDEEEEEEDVDDEEDEDLEDEEEDDEDVSQMSEDDVAKDEENEENAAITAENDKTADKATAVRNQRRVWDDLMYANIRMHALLNLTNQMPRGEARKNLLKTCDEKTMTSLQNALANMAKLRSVVQQSSSSFGKKEKAIAKHLNRSHDSINRFVSNPNPIKQKKKTGPAPKLNSRARRSVTRVVSNSMKSCNDINQELNLELVSGQFGELSRKIPTSQEPSCVPLRDSPTFTRPVVSTLLEGTCQPTGRS
uniref:AATF-Che1 domain-containing protein n=1 Tax=Caenorhabditis japonica TaxID=281687 RepID=A0A8R1DLP7_CAEJA